MCRAAPLLSARRRHVHATQEASRSFLTHGSMARSYWQYCGSHWRSSCPVLCVMGPTRPSPGDWEVTQGVGQLTGVGNNFRAQSHSNQPEPRGPGGAEEQACPLPGSPAQPAPGPSFSPLSCSRPSLQWWHSPLGQCAWSQVHLHTSSHSQDLLPSAEWRTWEQQSQEAPRLGSPRPGLPR